MTRTRSGWKPLLKNETSKAAEIRNRGLRRSHRKQKAKPFRIEASAVAEGRGLGSRRSYPKAGGKRNPHAQRAEAVDLSNETNAANGIRNRGLRRSHRRQRQKAEP